MSSMKETLEGEFTLEKKAYIVNESNYISEVLASEKQIRMLYDLGELSREEYISSILFPQPPIKGVVI